MHRRQKDAALFSDRVRTERDQAGFAESHFAFVDRVDQPYWERIRQELNRWFAAYPEGEAARDLRSRFRKDDEGQHLGAWWELYLHRLLTRLGYTLDVHPELADTSRRPDFRVHGPGGSFLLEAAAVFSGIEDAGLHPMESQLLDIIEGAQADRFTLMLDVARLGTSMPRAGEVLRAIESWLATLPDTGWDDAQHLPTHTLVIRDWEVELVAFPLAPEHRSASAPLLASGPGTAGTVNDTAKLRGALDRKHRRYRHCEFAEPFVLAALMTSTFADLAAVEKALFGDTALAYHVGQRGRERWVRLPNGFWTRPDGPRATWASAVITGFQILPGAAAATAWPRLWTNPSAALPLVAELPLPRSSRAEDGSFSHDEAEGPYPFRDVFGLTREWPGPEAPFVGH